MPEDRNFLGQGWGFPPRFNRGGQSVAMVAEDEDIKQSLKLLLLTTPGERVMHPEFGCGIRSMVFDTMDTATITAIQDFIERAVLFFEPRVVMERWMWIPAGSTMAGWTFILSTGSKPPTAVTIWSSPFIF